MDVDARKEVAREFFSKRDEYESFVKQVEQLLLSLCPKSEVNGVTWRVKSEESFFNKSIKKENGQFKYADPATEIEDLIGVRIVCYTLSHVENVCGIIKDNFTILEEIDKEKELSREGKIGYVSKHFIASTNKDRGRLPEWKSFSSTKIEIQVRTVFQHTWAELEHRLQYKSSPDFQLRSRFQALAGLVQVADREFDGVVQLGNEIVSENKDSIQNIDDFDLDEESGHKLSDAAYMFGLRPRDLVAEERYDDAIRAYNALINLQPNQVWHYVGRAKARGFVGDVVGMENDIEIISEIKSTDERIKEALRGLKKAYKTISQ